MAMSITTTSGLRVLASRTAWRPDSASPTISMSRSVCSRARSPCRITVWSSASNTVILDISTSRGVCRVGSNHSRRRNHIRRRLIVPALERNVHPDASSSAGRGLDRKVTVHQTRALLHAQQAQPFLPLGGPARTGRRKAFAVVFNEYLDAAVDGAQGNVYLTGVRMLGHVRQAFLDQAEARGFLFPVQALARGAAFEPHGQPGALRVVP